MDIEKVEAMLIEAIGKAGLPILEVEQIKKNDSMFAIAASDDSQFLIKIEKHKPGEEILFEMGETGSKIQNIYDSYRNTAECNKMLMKNNLEIDWLLEKLELKDYRKLEDYILYYSSRNDELLFKLGFQYAWSLFTECAEKELVTES